jgi:UDP-N-acetylmuramoyl-tripeptide--D-alanyl-D-alanine ligase
MLTHADIVAGLGPLLLRQSGVASAPVERAVADSRLCRPGDLFVALPGETLDGNDFTEDAFARGATAVIAARPAGDPPAGRALFQVEDALTALHTLAAWWRGRFHPRVVALTGTVGKTSTKEITAHVLGARSCVLKTEASLNGDIGLPLMLLRLRPEHEVAVLELGLFYSGEIRLQCELARPRYGIVTNIGYTHASRLGSLDAIARAKRELVEWLPAEGTAALNADDPQVAAMAPFARCRVVRYGLSDGCDVRGDDIEDFGLDGLAFTVRTPDGSAHVRTPLLGRHNVHNCLAATAVALADGMALDAVAGALATATNPLRLKALDGPRGSTLIDDTYNANPASMAAALDVLAAVPGRRIAVLGDMLELGEEEERLHRELGERAARVADLLFVVGPRSRWTAAAARAAAPEVRHFERKEGLAAALAAEIRPGDVVLFKASRGMAFETVVEALRAGPFAADPAARADGVARAGGPAAQVVASHPLL